jgi:protein MpaA
MICHTVATIGYSHQGRPINAYYFGGGVTSIIYTGAIHGSEISSRDLMYRWIDYLEANARDIPADKTVVVIPQLNPDGVAAGTRVNARNVDLNRNFATSDWQKDVTTVDNQPFPGGGGETPMSEPETQAIAAMVQQLRPALVLSYHSIGGLIIANQAGSSSNRAATYSQLSGYYNATGQSSPFEYSASGTADDWYAQKLGVPSLLIELGSHTYHQFDRNQSAMWAMLQ